MPKLPRSVMYKIVSTYRAGNLYPRPDGRWMKKSNSSNGNVKASATPNVPKLIEVRTNGSRYFLLQIGDQYIKAYRNNGSLELIDTVFSGDVVQRMIDSGKFELRVV